MTAQVEPRASPPTPTAPLDVGRAYDDHADLVYRALQRMGVSAVDAGDLLQEVFLVLHRRRRDVDPARSLEGMSGKQIAEALGIPVGTVHSRLHAARSTIAAALEELP